VSRLVGSEMCIRDRYKNKYIKLKNQIAGTIIPLIGFGCGGMWRSTSDDITHFILYALSIGYRCLDCAYYYRNELQIKRAIELSRIPREEIFIIGKADTEEQFNIHIEKLDVGYINLGLIHSYESIEKLCELWNFMCIRKEQGIMKEIGISNISLKDLIALNEYCIEKKLDKPSFIQNKIHLYYLDMKLIEYCKDNSIHIIAHSPLGGMNYKELEDIINPIENHTISQIMLRYLINMNITVIPSARNESRILENYEAFSKGNFIPYNYNYS
jgi:diketogulonate reductase-like aldo/keto reductase